MAATRALYWKRPSEAELAGTGLKPKHYTEPDVHVWPEAWDAIQFFTRVLRQWRVGQGGAYALDYLVVFHELDRLNLPPDRYDEMLAQLRVIEDAALEVIHKD
ncbi:hypothetical protein BJI69_14355 [Luteibacter rhizovicinus DSM 16549]|uniref:DUF1799 domain-containing protein n=1 Tax=Luteibacter rhizovicinus DSM 16549 TaxID=1440763 RepID=A0A1L3EV78_9GAMM|nr:hypothetical protein BJI69_14355 [Luteibacter rhizovicinus DSM 16549]